MPVVRAAALDAGHGRTNRDGPASALPFLAQRIAQERLTTGLHIEPHQAGAAAYRAAAGGQPGLVPAAEHRLDIAV